MNTQLTATATKQSNVEVLGNMLVAREVRRDGSNDAAGYRDPVSEVGLGAQASKTQDTTSASCRAENPPRRLQRDAKIQQY